MAKAKERTLTRAKSAAAYTLVDLSSLHQETRRDIIEDAYAGGGVYGIRVVEESVNGAARAPIFGVYNDGPDADRWADAKKELGITGSEMDDGDVVAVDVEVVDPRREAALREAAAQQASGEADKIRAGERDALALAGVVEDDDAPVRTRTPNPSADRTGATDGHPQNIVDATLDPNAENEVGKAEAHEANAATRKKANKAPK